MPCSANLSAALAITPVSLPASYHLLLNLCNLQGGSAARPLLADIIHDGSKQARVRVEGEVNGQPFVVERTANKK